MLRESGVPHLRAWLFQVYFHPLDAGKFFSGSEDGLVQLSSVAGVLDEEEGFLVSCATPCAVCMRPEQGQVGRQHLSTLHALVRQQATANQDLDIRTACCITRVLHTPVTSIAPAVLACAAVLSLHGK